MQRQEVRNKLIAEYESKLKKIRSKMKRESCNIDKTGEKATKPITVQGKGFVMTQLLKRIKLCERDCFH